MIIKAWQSNMVIKNDIQSIRGVIIPAWTFMGSYAVMEKVWIPVPMRLLSAHTESCGRSRNMFSSCRLNEPGLHDTHFFNPYSPANI